ncbi:MAG: hypothetical protein HQK75_07300 [Candidatus Magnetomorum sp.]|nr:hypothetical protein [Candidatus Magnetomorum sp.]
MLKYNYSNLNRVFETTYKDLSNKLNCLQYPSDSYLRVIIEVIENDYNASKPRSEPLYKFLNDDVWDDEYTPVDLAENHDKYLYNDEY